MNSQSTFTDLQSDQDAVTALYNAATQQTEIDDYINQLNTIETDLQKANDQLVMFHIMILILYNLVLNQSL